MTKRDPTDFEMKVYKATSKVPRGKVTTYGLVARHIGCGSAQAVGQALKRNPFAPKVPCHRVLASSLALGGFMGKRDGRALKRKLEMLTKEDVTFEAGKAAERHLFRFRTGKKRGSQNGKQPGLQPGTLGRGTTDLRQVVERRTR